MTIDGNPEDRETRDSATQVANSQHASAMITGLCDAVRVLAYVLAEDERARALLNETCEAFMVDAPRRLGLLALNDHSSAVLLAGYREGLSQLVHGLNAREGWAEEPSAAH